MSYNYGLYLPILRSLITDYRGKREFVFNRLFLTIVMRVGEGKRKEGFVKQDMGRREGVRGRRPIWDRHGCIIRYLVCDKAKM